MNIRIHTKGIKGSGMVEEGETPGVMFGAVLEIDGVMLEQSDRVDIRFEEGVALVTARMMPSSIEIVSHTKESWPGVEKSIEQAVTARNAMGQALGRG
jgi:hypothetical protein